MNFVTIYENDGTENDGGNETAIDLTVSKTSCIGPSRELQQLQLQSTQETQLNPEHPNRLYQTRDYNELVTLLNGLLNEPPISENSALTSVGLQMDIEQSHSSVGTRAFSQKHISQKVVVQSSFSQTYIVQKR